MKKTNRKTLFEFETYYWLINLDFVFDLSVLKFIFGIFD